MTANQIVSVLQGAIRKWNVANIKVTAIQIVSVLQEAIQRLPVLEGAT